MVSIADFRVVRPFYDGHDCGAGVRVMLPVSNNTYKFPAIREADGVITLHFGSAYVYVILTVPDLFPSVISAWWV